MPDNFFHVIEGSAVILYSKGVYKQGKVFSRGADVYASHGGGYIKLGGRINFGDKRGHTSHPNVSWEELDAESVKYEKGDRSPQVFIIEKAVAKVKGKPLA